MPLNHFSCRCGVQQLREEEASVSPDDVVEGTSEKVGGEMQDIFKISACKDKVVFSDEHPYFNIEKKDRGFARENFDLPIPKTD